MGGVGRPGRGIGALGFLLLTGCESTNSLAARRDASSRDDASVCPSSPTHPTTTTQAVYTPAQVANLCTTLESCFPMDFSNVWTSAHVCLNGGESASAFIPMPGDLEANALSALEPLPRAIDPAVIDFYNCVLAQHGDCRSVAACLLLDPSSDVCSAGKGDGLANGTCKGSLLHGCTADGNPFAVDCARLDAACVDAIALLSPGSCTWALCPPDASLCDGANIVECTVSGNIVDVFD